MATSTDKNPTAVQRLRSNLTGICAIFADVANRSLVRCDDTSVHFDGRQRLDDRTVTRTNPRRKRPPPELNVSVLKSFRVIYGSVRHHFREVERTCGISGSQIWILHELIKADGIGVSELAEKLSIHQSTCSQLVEKLVRAGHVTKARQRTDQRRVVLAVSAKGRRALDRVPGPAEGVLPEAIAELSKAELRGLHRGLQRVIAALDVTDDEAGNRPLADL